MATFAFLDVVTISRFLLSTMSYLKRCLVAWRSVPARPADSSEVLHSAAVEPSSVKEHGDIPICECDSREFNLNLVE